MWCILKTVLFGIQLIKSCLCAMLYRCRSSGCVSISPCTVALYQFVERTYTVRENISSLMITVELAPSSGTLLDSITLTVSSVGGSATGLVLSIWIIY